jgi:hypothetical protein
MIEASAYFTTQPLYPLERNPFPLTRRLGGPQSPWRKKKETREIHTGLLSEDRKETTTWNI